MNNSQIQAIITRSQGRIVEYENAIDNLISDQIESYMLDTGQSSQRVTKLNIQILEGIIDLLMNRCVTLQARLSGSGTTYVRPAF